ncbi:LysM peptidoglycan-binding domain-containing protein [Leuconostoc lactis]|uniref:LysM peptidoglycan-binding domain-containing protein n=1 Tax=Leuconostoc lactis TaxID=1246 RepID=UPI0015F4E5A2|nr:LysM domain-containing protein [Leuconostoc lactis]MBA5812596.1 LysM peptidoglycan-binding domain-containing protein [Leuconostoc lactis]MBU7538303.1 LysM peptidoglycan-binding domain-containing protein [Leuconostoc lactis]MDI6496470.1 LysM domain-containing protein [Leuconostoc lactis]MDI6573963.1 LysM domain-containing protein [Leuconostoc lactis]
MLSFKKTLTVAAGVASAFAFGASHASADTTDSQNRPTDYVVKAGDTLNKLSSEYNTTVEDIAAKNNITDVNLIFVGQHLTFAEAAASQATAAPAQAPAAPVQQAPVQQAPAAAPVRQAAPQVSSSAALNALIARESGGNVHARNGQYYGIGQLSAQARAVYGGNSADYNDQLNAMKAYIAARYGTAENAWAHSQATGWY